MLSLCEASLLAGPWRMDKFWKSDSKWKCDPSRPLPRQTFPYRFHKRHHKLLPLELVDNAPPRGVVDPTHWVLDVAASISINFTELKEVCFCLTQPGLLGDDAALGLYARCGGEWSYCGSLANGRPSEVFALKWPDLTVPLGPGVVQIGVSVEPLSEVQNKEMVRAGSKAEYAKRVALDLLRFIESFGHALPVGIIERWYSKFSDKFQRDPDFLTRQDLAL